MKSRTHLNHLLEMKVGPAHETDGARLLDALFAMTSADRYYSFAKDLESGETILRANDEMHLDRAIDEIKSAHAIDVVIGAPQVAYLESPAGTADADYTHKRLKDGIGQFARVILRVSPSEEGTGNHLRFDMSDDSIPPHYKDGIRLGVESLWNAGILAGFPCIDTTVTVRDGAFHETDSSAQSFEIAGRMATREACGRAEMKLLEPIMAAAVIAPEPFLSEISCDLKRRCGEIVDATTENGNCTIKAMLPLSNMLGYIDSLRSLTKGLGSYVLDYSHHEPVPRPGDDPDNFPQAVGMRA